MREGQPGLQWQQRHAVLRPCACLGSAQGDFESDVLRVSFSSLATPPTTIDYNMATGKQCVALR